MTNGNGLVGALGGLVALSIVANVAKKTMNIKPIKMKPVKLKQNPLNKKKVSDSLW